MRRLASKTVFSGFLATWFFCRIPDQALSVSEGNVRRCGAVALVVCDDFDP